jgi:predicted amidophosphoribosyltransferase
MHGLKYRGFMMYADLVAETLAPRLPQVPLVPVPRALSRLVKYGIDPARELSLRIARINRVPVISGLRRPIHSLRRAGSDHTRPVGGFAVRTPIGFPVLVVDDVLTTGATLVSAIAAVGPHRVVAAVVANDAGFRSTLAPDVF